MVGRATGNRHHWPVLLEREGELRALREAIATAGSGHGSLVVVEGDPGIGMPENEKTSIVANRRLVDDWIDAIRNDREPICSGKAATAAIEMVMAVYQAAIGGRRVEFPLTERRHPLVR